MTMKETASITCRICLMEVMKDEEFYTLSKDNDLMLHSKLLSFVPDMDLSITLNPVACNQCTVKIDQTHEFRQLCIRNEIILKNQMLLQSCLTNNVDNNEEVDENECLLVNTDIPVCVEESTPEPIFYYCNHCHYGTNMKDNLIDHIFTHRLKCNLCTYTTPNRFLFILHKEIHSNIGPFQCNNCRFTCIEPLAFDNHKCIKTDFKFSVNKMECRNVSRKILNCPDCGYQTNTNTALKHHMVTHKKMKALTCKLCSFVAHSKKGLATHALKHKNQNTSNSTSSRKQVTRITKKKRFKYNRIGNLKIHPTSPENEIFDLKSVQRARFNTYLWGQETGSTVEKRFKCSMCDYRTTRIGYLEMHLNRHSFKCDKCDYKTLTKIEFLNHKKVHANEHDLNLSSHKAVTKEKKYKCSMCDFGSGRMGHLQTHIIGIHSFKCDECDYKTLIETEFLDHKTVHTMQQAPSNANLSNPKAVGAEEKMFKCKLCDYRCIRIGHLQMHMISIHSFTCDECGYKTLLETEFLNHKAVHTREQNVSVASDQVIVTDKNKKHKTVKTGKKRFKCNLCDFKSIGSRYLQKHMNRIHSFKCDECGYKTLVEVEFLDHKTVHTREENVSSDQPIEITQTHTINNQYFKCDECDFETLSEIEFWDHKQIHTMEQQNVSVSNDQSIITVEMEFKCNLCEYRSDRIDDIQTHMENKHSLKCDDGDYQTSTDVEFLDADEEPITNLSRPKAVSTEEQKFKCHLCDYKSTRNAHLQTHMNSKHSFKCDECGYKTLMESEFLDHKTVHTRAENVSVSNDQALITEGEKLKCNLCDYTSYRIANLQTHMEVKHSLKCDEDDVEFLPSNVNLSVSTEEKKFKCQLCDYRGSRNAHLQRHMNSKHSFKCDECGYKTLMESEFLDHKTVHTREEIVSVSSDEAIVFEESARTDDLQFLDHRIVQADEPAPSNVNLSSHKAVSTEEKKFKCHLCDYRSVRNYHLQMHMNSKHYFKCDECGYKTLIKSEFLDHKSIHTREENVGVSNGQAIITEGEKLKCNLCDYKTYRIGNLQTHMEIKHSLKCDEDDVEVLEQTRSNANLSIPTEEKKFKCDLCDYRCARNGYLQTHMNSKHSFKCNECGYKTLIESEFLDHKTVHTREEDVSVSIITEGKKFKCNLCDYRSYRISNLQTHMEIKHSLKCDEGDYQTSTDVESLQQTPSNVNLYRRKATSTEEKKFQCHLCDYRSTRNAHLQTHMNNKHSFKCDECGYTTLMEVEFLDHKAVHTREENLRSDQGIVFEESADSFKCDECGYTTLMEVEFLDHKAVHTREENARSDQVIVFEESVDSFKCDECDFETLLEIEFWDHKTIHIGEQNDQTIFTEGNNFNCDLCGYRSDHIGHLQTHMKNHHLQSTEFDDKSVHALSIEEKKFKCKLCDYRSDQNADLQVHMTNAHSFKCDECDYETVMVIEFLDHKALHAGEENVKVSSNQTIVAEEKNFKCNLCDYRSAQVGHLQTHTINNHSFKCDECDYKTLLEIEFWDHRTMHTKEQNVSVSSDLTADTEEENFKCNLCDFKSTLNAHLQTHINSKHSFKCDECCYKTLTEVELFDHKIVHTKEQKVSDNTEENMFKCKRCDYKCDRVGHLRYHSRKHSSEFLDSAPSNSKRKKCTKQSLYKCNVCDYKSNLNGNLKVHMYRHSGDWPYKCGECAFRTHDKQKFTQHNRKHQKVNE